MTLEQYGEFSNYAAGSALVVLFIAFVVHLAEWYVAHRSEALVSVAAGGVADQASEGSDLATPNAADRLEAVGFSLTVLGTLLVTLAAILRGLASQRVPLGNMYEFGLSGAAVALIVYVVMVKLSGVQWLSVPVLAIVLLVLGLSIRFLH